MQNDNNVDPQFVAALKKIEPWLRSKATTAYIPETVEGDKHLTGSKYGGLPYLPDGKWPTCGLCNEPLLLFLQVNLADAPKQIRDRLGTGIFQFFYCTTYNSEHFCHGDCYGDAFEKNHTTRIIEYVGDCPVVPYANLEYAAQALEEVKEPLTIVEWKESADLPSIYELPEIGLEVPELESYFRCEELGIDLPHNYFLPFLEWYAHKEKFEYEFDSEDEFAIEYDKLGGWPSWMHGTEVFQDCPVCGKPADEFIGQVAAYDGLSYDFGDGGTVYFYRCRQHPDQIGALCSSG